MKVYVYCSNCGKKTNQIVENNKRKCLECKKEKISIDFGGFFLS